MNYQKELDQIIEKLEKENRKPGLLIHSCCAPCSSYVLEYLSNFFAITVFYYNPNIFPEEEYSRRAAEQENLIRVMPLKGKVDFLQGDYVPQDFYNAVRGLETELEGGERWLS